METKKAFKFDFQRRHSWMITTCEQTRHRREAWTQEKGRKKKKLNNNNIIKNKLVHVELFWVVVN